MTMATVAAVGGLALSAYGAYDSYQQAGDMQSAQNRALAGARTSLNGFQALGNGGMGATYRNNPNGYGGQIDLNAGALNPAMMGFQNYANSMVPRGPGGLPPEVARAMQGVVGNSGIPGMNDAGLRSIEQMNSQMGSRFAGDVMSNMGGFQTGLQNTAFRGAGQQMQDAMMGGEQARSRTLDLLRAQAAPHEGRAFNRLNDTQFATGRAGTTGGGIQTEAFARGLGEADLSRQLAAADEGRAFQQNAMGLSQSMAGMGTGLRQTQDSLLNSAFGRFSQTQQLGADLNRQRYERSIYGNQLGYDRSRDILGLQTNLAQMPMQLDAMRLGNANTALQGQAGIQEQLMQLFSGGLQAESAGANARLGSASNQAAIVGSPNFGLGGQMQASTYSQLGGALMGGQSATDILGRMFQPTARPTGQMGPAGSGVMTGQPAYGTQPYPQWGWGS
jgi:hypothetical protein